MDIMHVTNKREAVEPRPEPGKEQTCAPVSVHDAGTKDLGQAPRLIETEMKNALTLKQWHVTPTSRRHCDNAALPCLLNRKVDCGIHYAVSAIGYIMEDVQYSHPRLLRDCIVRFPVSRAHRGICRRINRIGPRQAH